MVDRPKFFDDLAGVAGGAMSALSGVRDEVESLARARMEEMIRKLDLVRREDLEAVQEIAARARAAQDTLEARVAALEAAHESARAPQAETGTDGAADAPALGEPSMPPPNDAAEEPRPETPELRAPKSAT